MQISSRLGLHVPETTDPFLTSDFQTNWGKVDNYPGIFTTTSGSRPSSPWTGQHIFETDTKQTMVFDGGSWGPPISNLAWAWWAGVSPWLSTSGGGTPLAGSYYTYGAHKFRILNARTNQALVLSGAITLEMEDPQPSSGKSNFAGVFLYMNGNQLPQVINTSTVMDASWDLFPYNRPSLNALGQKITFAMHPQLIAIGSNATNAKLNQDNSITLKVANGFLNGRVRCTGYTLHMTQCTLGPGSNKPPGLGSVPTTFAV